MVVAHHVTTVGRHRVRARTLVQNSRHVVVEVAVAEAFDEFVLVDVIGDLAVDQVAKLVGAGEIVHRDDVALAAQIERLDEVGADESRSTGDDDVHAYSRWLERAEAQTSRSTFTAVVTVNATRGATAHSSS